MNSQPAVTTQNVIDHYSAMAKEDPFINAEHIKKIAESFGYAPEDLAAIPEGANLGVSCGNPLAIAGLRPGETVLDLGSGAGFDVFQAAIKVGPTGLSIGLDMSPEMLKKARANALRASNAGRNVKFIESSISKIPLEGETVDCIISNCVINLLPQEEKIVCFREVYRTLKPGGRFSVSDILAKKRIPEQLVKDLSLYVGCISGASLASEYERWLKEAGFEDVVIVDKQADLNLYKERLTTDIATEQAAKTEEKPTLKSCCGGAAKVEEKPAESSGCGSASNRVGKDQVSLQESKERISAMDLNEFVSSFSVYAVKPAKKA